MSGFLLDVGMKGWGVINFIQQAFIPLFLQVHLGTEPNRILFPEKGFVIFFFLPHGQCLVANITIRAVARDHGMEETLYETPWAPSRVLTTFDPAIQAPCSISYLFCSCEKRGKD